MSNCKVLSVDKPISVPLLKSISKVDANICKIQNKQSEHPARGTKYVVDCGAQATVSNSSEGLSNIDMFKPGSHAKQMSVLFPNGSTAKSVGKGTAVFSDKLKVDVNIFNKSDIRERLLNPGELLDAGKRQGLHLEVVLDESKIEVRSKETGDILLAGPRDPFSKLWTLSTIDISTLKRSEEDAKRVAALLSEESTHLTLPLDEEVDEQRVCIFNLVRTHELNIAEKATFLSYCFPSSVATLSDAMNRNYFTLPWLSAKQFDANLPQTGEAIAKGHLTANRSGSQSTKIDGPIIDKGMEEIGAWFKGKQSLSASNQASSSSPPASSEKTAFEKRTRNATKHFRIKVEKHNTLSFADQTGKFPVESEWGETHIMLIVSNSGFVKSIALKGSKGAALAEGWKEAYETLRNTRNQISFGILDNECSKELRDAFEEADVYYQLVAPGDHSANLAERYIRTYKEFFLSVLFNASKDFPLKYWSLLLPGIDMYLNVLTPCRHNPNISCATDHYGVLDWSRYIIAPLACKVEVKEKNLSWSYRSRSGFNLGFSIQHCRTMRVYIPSMNSIRLSNAVEFIPEQWKAPGVDRVEQMTDAITQLTTTILAAARHAHNISDESRAKLETLVPVVNDVFSQVRHAISNRAEEQEKSIAIGRKLAQEKAYESVRAESTKENATSISAAPREQQHAADVERVPLPEESSKAKPKQITVSASVERVTPNQGSANHETTIGNEAYSSESSNGWRDSKDVWFHDPPSAPSDSDDEAEEEEALKVLVRPRRGKEINYKNLVHAKSSVSNIIESRISLEDFLASEPGMLLALNNLTGRVLDFRGSTVMKFHYQSDDDSWHITEFQGVQLAEQTVIAEHYEPLSENNKIEDVWARHQQSQMFTSAPFQISSVQIDDVSPERKLQLEEAVRSSLAEISNIAQSTAIDLNLDPITGKKINWTDIRNGPRAVQGNAALMAEIVRLVEQRRTMRFIPYHDKPPNSEKATYATFVVKIKLVEGIETLRVRCVIGGNLLNPEGERAAPTASLESVKIILNATISEHLLNGAEICSVDLGDFYLMSDLPVPSYISFSLSQFTPEIIERYNLMALERNGKVLAQVTGGMYGHPLAGIGAYKQLDAWLKVNNFVNTVEMPCVYKHETRKGLAFVLIVDDFLIKFHSQDDRDWLITTLEQKYGVKTNFSRKINFDGLDFELDYEGGKIKVSMNGEVASMLKRFNLQDIKGAQTPAIAESISYGAQSQLAKDDITDTYVPTAAEVKLLQQMVGSALWFSKNCDYSALFAVTAAASTPSFTLKRERLLRIFAYWKQFPEPFVTYVASDMVLRGVCDASYASEPGAKSRIGAGFWLGSKDDAYVVNNGLIEAASWKVDIVCGSVMEAEYIALYMLAQRAIFLKHICVALGYEQKSIDLYTDNACAKGIAEQSITMKRSRTVDIKYHWVRQRVQMGEFRIIWVPGQFNLADALTKPLPKDKFKIAQRQFVSYKPFVFDVNSTRAKKVQRRLDRKQRAH